VEHDQAQSLRRAARGAAARIVLYPFFEGGPDDAFGRSVISLFGLVVLVLAVLAVQRTPLITWVSWLIGLPVLVLTVVDAFTGWVEPWHFWSDAVHALFYVVTFGGLVLYMFRDDHVSTDEIFATGAAFTVAVWAFAYVYSMCQTLVPGSFTAAVDPDAPRTWVELLFLSCTTMTSTGLSDVVPVKPHSRSLVMLEQIGGMLYLALVVARLVGMTLARRALAAQIFETAHAGEKTTRRGATAAD